MKKTRLAIAMVGIVLPYLARVPGAIAGRPAWLSSYFHGGLAGIVLIGAFNGLAWGSILGLSFLVRKPSPLLLPAGLGFGFIAYAHSKVDLASDAQAAIALGLIPIYALPIIVVAFLISVGLLGRGL